MFIGLELSGPRQIPVVGFLNPYNYNLVSKNGEEFLVLKMIPALKHCFKEMACQSLGQSVCRSLSQSINQSVSQSVRESMRQKAFRFAVVALVVQLASFDVLLVLCIGFC